PPTASGTGGRARRRSGRAGDSSSPRTTSPPGSSPIERRGPSPSGPDAMTTDARTLELAGEGWCTTFARACAREGLGHDERIALLAWATGRPLRSSTQVRRDEVLACWRALEAYRR